MHAITVSAKCIKNQIVLSEPIPISENAELLVTILPSEKKQNQALHSSRIGPISAR